MKRLVVNADDFGLTPGVNRAVAELHRAGVLTSTTLMATGAAFEEAAALARELPGLGIGCHVTLVDGSPVLPPAQIASLAGIATGRFRPTLGGFVRDLLSGRIHGEDIEAEAAAQIRRLQQAGIHVTHVDTHKHTHIFPQVLRPLLRAALACGVPAIRNPFEPDWSRRATTAAGLLRRLQVQLLATQRRSFLAATRKAGLATTSGAIGVLATGSLDAATLSSLLAAMPEGTWELCCHPGYVDAALSAVHTRLRRSREVERAALAEVLPRFSGLHLIHFGQPGGIESTAAKAASKASGLP